VAKSYEKGVLVDAKGTYLGAFKWEKGTPRPQFNASKTPPEERLRLLTSEAAIADPVVGGRWDAKAERWIAPDVPVWIVNTRRDLPRYGSLAGKRMVFSDQRLDLPDWQAEVRTAPPEKRPVGRKLLWDFEAEEWVLPKPVLRLAEDGTVLHRGLKPRPDPEDVNPDDLPTAEDEAGRPTRCGKGDKITNGAPVIQRRRPYPRVPVGVLLIVLQERKLGAKFKAFVEGKGYSIEDVRELGTISLGNKLLREFITGEGFTMKQAYQAIQRRAEEIVEERAAKKQALGAEE
jgi:hypothetical protein